MPASKVLQEKQKQERLGLKKINNEGYEMTIIEYNSYNDLTVQFENGYINRNKTYQNFQVGHISNIKAMNEQFSYRVGEVRKNRQGIDCEIIKYVDSQNIDVKFLDNTVLKNRTYGEFVKGSIRNNNHPTFFGVGYLGYGNIPKGFMCGNVSVIAEWSNVLLRCSSKHKSKREAWENNSIDDSWLNYQNFANWFKDNYYEIPNQRMCVDKDWLIHDNRHYSSETCLIVPENINQLINIRKTKPRKYPIGVNKDSKNYYAMCTTIGYEDRRLGTYKTPEEAFYAYKFEKEKRIKEIADEYMSKYPQFPQRVYDAMYAYEVYITD